MNATLIHHQGFGDLFTNNALCNYYSERYNNIVLFAFDENRRAIMKKMYSHLDNVEVVIPDYTTKKTGDSCIQCHTDCFNHHCPRGPFPTCQFIDYSKYNGYANLKFGCFENFSRWSKFLSKEKSFSHAFYSYVNLDKNIRINNFKISRDIEEENKVFERFKFSNQDYIVIHDDKDRNLIIDEYHLKSSKNIYQLNSSSKIMIDQLKILENAKEIHLIDSSYSVLIYFLSFNSEKLSNIPKYIHSYANRNRDYNIYTDPVPKNWFIL